MKRASPGEAGFTLVELLVSLALMGLMAALLGNTLYAAGRFSTDLSPRQASDGRIAAIQQLLRQRIERLRGVTSLNSSVALVDVRGNPQDFAFFAPAPGSGGPDMLQRFRLVRTATGDLILYQANGLDDRIDLNAKGMLGWRPHVLLRDVSYLGMSYFGIDPIAGSRRWQPQWHDRPQPPELIRIRVAFPSGDKRRWPALIVRPRATVNTACRIDVLTGKCAGDL